MSSFSLALTHDRVPDYNPLPDIVLDNTTYHQWGLKVCEIIIIISILLAFLTVLLHTHRLIVIRRVFLNLGLLYMYRGLTMFSHTGDSPKWVKSKRRRKKEKRRLNDGENNGQATHGARKHAWRTQAAWANK